MRLFVALPLPSQVRQELVEVVTRWRQLQWPLRWVNPESLHVTMRFLGEVDPADESRLRTALDECGKGTGWIDLVPQAYDFSPARRPRILWLALEPVPALELLAHRVALGLGAPGDEGVFRPHVTLGRVAHGARVPADAFAAVRAAPLPAASGTDELVLYQSELDGGPPRYSQRHAVMLGR